MTAWSENARAVTKSDATRRDFIRTTAAGSVGAVMVPHVLTPAARAESGNEETPWYRRTLRWGQTNISEEDPASYDVAWWRQHWRRTRTQGLVINAGGIVAYYPSRFSMHYRAEYLENRDLYGELTRAAHEDGLVVLARMDSNRAREEFYRAHPDWFARDINGEPYRAAERYISCIDSPYYEEYLLDVVREIIAWEKPEGFTDNSWSGLGQDEICYCEYSRGSFRRATGRELPSKKDWDDPDYRQWIKWSYKRRLEVWDLNNRAMREAGGPDCLWLGMIGGDFISQGRRFRDIKALLERSEMVMLDDQSRSDGIGFLGNSEMGKRLHGVLGWEKNIPESMATYQRSPTFRKSAASKPEARMWMYAGFAGGIQPWWHHVGAFQWDRRQFQTAMPVYDWYEKNEGYLVNRRPVATVGVVYSQENADFYGRDDARERVAFPYYGIVQALVRARIPYIPVHADHIERDGRELSLLILPGLGAMTETQIVGIRRFVEGGGGLLATGETSLYDEWGDPRADFALADVLGVRFTGKRHGSLGVAQTWGGGDHTYLRLLPDLGGEVYGPVSGAEPVVSRPRHPVLKGFEETDILPFGGWLLEVAPQDDTEVPVTFIPDFPAYPPEISWMREPRTDIPGLVLRDSAGGGGRRAYFAADLDRRFFRDNLPDHGDLLRNVVRWAAGKEIPLQVKGTGLIDCHLYRQPDRLVLHLVNLTSAGTWRSPVHELISVGPLEIGVKIPREVHGRAVRYLVSGERKPVARRGDWAIFEVASLTDHEIAVVE